MSPLNKGKQLVMAQWKSPKSQDPGPRALLGLDHQPVFCDPWALVSCPGIGEAKQNPMILPQQHAFPRDRFVSRPFGLLSRRSACFRNVRHGKKEAGINEQEPT